MHTLRMSNKRTNTQPKHVMIMQTHSRDHTAGFAAVKQGCTQCSRPSPSCRIALQSSTKHKCCCMSTQKHLSSSTQKRQGLNIQPHIHVAFEALQTCLRPSVSVVGPHQRDCRSHSQQCQRRHKKLCRCKAEGRLCGKAVVLSQLCRGHCRGSGRGAIACMVASPCYCHHHPVAHSATGWRQ